MPKEWDLRVVFGSQSATTVEFFACFTGETTKWSRTTSTRSIDLVNQGRLCASRSREWTEKCLLRFSRRLNTQILYETLHTELRFMFDFRQNRLGSPQELHAINESLCTSSFTVLEDDQCKNLDFSSQVQEAGGLCMGVKMQFLVQKPTQGHLSISNCSPHDVEWAGMHPTW